MHLRVFNYLSHIRTPPHSTRKATDVLEEANTEAHIWTFFTSHNKTRDSTHQECYNSHLQKQGKKYTHHHSHEYPLPTISRQHYLDSGTLSHHTPRHTAHNTEPTPYHTLKLYIQQLLGEINTRASIKEQPTPKHTSPSTRDQSRAAGKLNRGGGSYKQPAYPPPHHTHTHIHRNSTFRKDKTQPTGSIEPNQRTNTRQAPIPPRGNTFLFPLRLGQRVGRA